MTRRGARATVGVLLTGLALAACGSDEHDFKPETLIDALNAAGADLVLGEPLPDVESGEVHRVSFEAGAGAEAGDAHGSGSLLLVDDADRAREEFQRCEQAVSFVCFRIANAVLRFNQITAEERARTESALRALETDPGE